MQFGRFGNVYPFGYSEIDSFDITHAHPPPELREVVKSGARPRSARGFLRVVQTCGRTRNARVAKLADAADLGSELKQPDSPEIEKTSAIGDPSGPEIGAADPGVGQSRGNQTAPDESGDPVEFELAKALGKAADFGRFDVVAQLARELEARRLARLTNVVMFDKRRKRAT
jgi:hypothetical protein